MTHAIPENACEITVASAAPATPIGNTMIKSRSSPIFTNAASARKIRGVLLSPIDLITPDTRLYR